MQDVRRILAQGRAVIGMIHVAALPGTPRGRSSMREIVARAREEALIYRAAGVDAIAIENMHDTPYLKGRVGPEITAAMAVVGMEVKQAAELPCGIQILAGANREALAVAKAADLDFIRAEGFVFAHVADEGVIESCAGDLLRYRRQIEAAGVLVLTDVKKKHSSHAITADVTLATTARAAEFFSSDGIIVTGLATGEPADPAEVDEVKRAVGVPVLVGSGVTLENVDAYLGAADALIVGSWFKHDGRWDRPVDADRVTEFMRKVQVLRKAAAG
jgi:uncharacterized protein